MANLRLTLADQVLIWSATVLAGPACSPADAKLFAGIVQDILPHVSRGTPQVAAVAAAARDVIARSDPRVDTFRLGHALSDFARWRAGLSYDAFAAKANGEDAA